MDDENVLTRILVFAAISLYVVSTVLKLLSFAGGLCGSICVTVRVLGADSALILAGLGGVLYSLISCPVFYAGIAAAISIYGSVGKFALALPIIGVAVDAYTRRYELSRCMVGFVAAFSVIGLYRGLSGVAALLGYSIGFVAPPWLAPGVELAGRVVSALSSLPGLLFIAAAALAAHWVAGGLIAAAAVLKAFAAGSIPAPVMSAVELVAVAGAGLIMLSSAAPGAEEQLLPIEPERPTGHVERTLPRSTRAAPGSYATQREETREARARAVEESRMCRRSLHEFVALVRRIGSPEWQRLFEACIRGRSIYGYRIEDVLGVGADGLVFRARDEDTGDPAAFKMILPEPVNIEAEDSRRAVTKALQLIESLEREGASLRELSAKSPYIVRVKAIHTDAEKFRLAIRRDSFDIYIKNPPSIIMEYMAGGSVEKLIDRAMPGKPEWQRIVAAIIAATASALHVVHEHGYVHSDVKPGNILLSQPLPSSAQSALHELMHGLRDPQRARVVPKLSDLGVASRKGEPVKGFTPLYAAPEILLYEAACLGPGGGSSEICMKPLLAEPSQDIYSLGVVALQLYTGAGKKLLSSWMNLLHRNPGVLDKLLEGKAPREAVEFIKRMLSTKPEERPPASMVAKFFRGLALGAT